MEMVIEGDLILDPDYQRKYRWSDQKASRFIESIALNIPVPVFYFAEEPDGTFSVIDGQQRLTSLFRYLKPQELSSVFGDDITELTLADLKVRSDLNGKKYADLERAERALLSKRPLRCIVVLNESDETLKFEVFERLNSGSASLTDQEVRNCLYRGPLNELLKELADNTQFKELVSLPDAAQKNMKDVELVLRFFAYRELNESSKYSDSYTEHLNTFMEENREISDKRRAQMRALFEETVGALHSSLGPSVAFRKPLDMGNPQSSAFANNLINGSIYESQMVSVSKLIEAGDQLPADLRGRLLSAFTDPNYTGAVLQGGTAKKSKVLARTRVLDALLV
ncbi:GmrSD restriction endonuclease domain-containing protein [Lysobacter xanthus]